MMDWVLNTSVNLRWRMPNWHHRHRAMDVNVRSRHMSVTEVFQYPFVNVKNNLGVVLGLGDCCLGAAWCCRGRG